MQLHARTHKCTCRPATARMDRGTHTHTKAPHLHIQTCTFVLANTHSVIYIQVFQSPPSVSLAGRILLLEHKAIRKQNAGNINENGDFSERLKMKRGVVEEVGIGAEKRRQYEK